MEKGKIIAKDKYELLLETCDNFNDFLMYTATDGGNHHEYNITSLSFELIIWKTRGINRSQFRNSKRRHCWLNWEEWLWKDYFNEDDLRNYFMHKRGNSI